MIAKRHKKRNLSSFQIIILGFLGVILLGAFLLMLPVSTKARVVTPFNEALFTSTSAVCVTGLVLHDTATYWSSFGQTVILILIQTGGLGVVTIATVFALLSGKKISLMQRSTMQDAISAPKLGGIVRFTDFILKGTIVVELLGAAFMAPTFCSKFGLKGIWYSIFHSISAFCNAGFDIMGTDTNKYQSLTAYVNSPTINIVIMLLIIIGGLGFLTWKDIWVNGIHFKKYSLQSKIILTMTLLLIVLPAIFFYFVDFSNFETKRRILSSLFQSVTTRTAGFNTVDLTNMSDPSKALMIALMLIGGAPGSTAGGMKNTTLAVLIFNALAVFNKREDPEVYGRRVGYDVVKSAATIAMMYVFLSLIGALAISTIENLPILSCIYETASAVATVGLTLGITTSVGIISRYILITLMFLGRVGGLTLIFATVSVKKLKNPRKYPLEKVGVG
jgi:trk system potassium uptake protein TrkH